MCGRYYVDDETAREIEKLVKQVSEKLSTEQKKGDIYPTNVAPILTEENNGLEVSYKHWGFPGFKNSKVIFNARSETALEKKMFRESILSRRCIIPARWFYEWDASKNKYTFFRKESNVLYMAGFYQTFADHDRFVILTTKPNASMSDIHDRMPLVLENDELSDWLSGNKMNILLQKEPPLLNRKSDYEQQVLQFEN